MERSQRGLAVPHTEVHRFSRRFLEPIQDLLILGLGLALFAVMLRTLAGLWVEIFAPHIDFRTIIETKSIGGQWEVEFMGRSIRPYDEGDVMAFCFSAGGAGYGDPLEADPADVARDFVGGLISAWTMREIYKVAYDEAEFKKMLAGL